MGRNPFAIKPTTPTRSEENREARPLVAPPTLVLGGGGGGDPPRSSGFVLRPSALSAQAAHLKVYAAPQPTTAQHNDEKSDSGEKSEDDVSSSTERVDKQKEVEEIVEEEKEEENQDVVTSSEESKVSKDTKDSFSFGHNLEARAKVSKADSSSCTPEKNGEKDSGGFVFGEKLHERISNPEAQPSSNSGDDKKELSFASAACVAESSDNTSQDSADSPSKGNKRSLNETAEEYQQRIDTDAKKSKLEEVEVITGEENESNVLQMNCKLFAFDSVKNRWLERGRGLLRLNDKQDLQDSSIQSRLVMRTQGSLRVMLNTKVWGGMVVEHPSPKSLRVSGYTSEGTIGIYLIQCTPKDADQLFNALDWRVNALKKNTTEGTPSNAAQRNSENQSETSNSAE